MSDLIDRDGLGQRATPVARRTTLAQQGYLVVHDLTDAEDLARCQRLLESLFERRVGYKEGRQFDMTGADLDGAAPRLPQIIAPRRYAPELEQTRTFKRAQALALELLGPDAVLMFDHVIKKPAHDGAITPWHQDEAFRDPAFAYQEVSIWVPLQAVDERNGCMMFVPLDRADAVLPHRSPNGSPNVHALECYAGFDPASAVACPLPAGGCTVHTGRTVHGAGPNLSDAPRYAYIMVFERPCVKRAEPRDFPWQAEKQTARTNRRRAWLWRGGFLILAGRKLRVAGRMLAQGRLGELRTEFKVKLREWLRG